jgi:transcriptional regulator with XRE-family HTH domain
MEAIAKKKNINQGRNIRLARNWKGITQEALAFDLSLSQKQISEIEAKETIDDALLDKIAASLKVSSDFLKSFELDEVAKYYSFNNQDSVNATAAENSENAVVQGQGEQENNITNNYNYPIDDIKELYKQIIDEKDKQIIRFENQVNELKKRIEKFESKMM